MHLNEVKDRVCGRIDDARERIIELGETILRHPELGFCEFKTAALAATVFKSLQLPVREGLAVTGVRAELDTGRPGPTVALLGELDALLAPTHRFADPATGAAHACGHHAQMAALLGAAIGLTEAGVTSALSGKIVFMAVPAEEFRNADAYGDLFRRGRIVYCGGKAELIRIGAFDDIAIALLTHGAHADFVAASSNGFVMKHIRVTGRPAHAGLRPQDGTNALSLARLAMNLVDAQRDTFADEDSVRIHGVFPNGGATVNIVPDRVDVILQVRAKTPEAVAGAAARVDRCFQGAALAFGGAVAVDTLPGYMPFKGCPDLERLHGENLARIDPAATFTNFGHRASSTDMGDVSMIIPSLNAYVGGFAGTAHGSDFRVVDPERAYVRSGKLLAMNAVDLLFGEAAEGRRIAASPVRMTRQAYLDAMARTAEPAAWNYLEGDPA